MKSIGTVILMLVLSAASSFAGAVIACQAAGSTDIMFAMGGIIGFMVPTACMTAAMFSRK